MNSTLTFLTQVAKIKYALTHRFAGFCSIPPFQGWHGKVSKCQITALVKVSILKTSHGVSVGATAAVHIGTAATEVEAARASTANRAAPTVAVGTDIEERTIAAEAEARQGQLERGSKSTRCIVAAPTQTLSI
jgi:hypothetical protein